MPGYRFLRTRLEALDFATLTRRVDAWLADPTAPSRHVACLNAYCVTLAHDAPRLQAVYDRADVAVPDGMPFVFWMRWRLRGEPCERFYGPDVVLHLAREAAARGWRFYLYGGTPELAPRVAAALEAHAPGLQIAGRHSPPFRAPTEEEDASVVAEIERLRPQVILVGLGTPKQDYWIGEHRDRLRGCVLVNVGAAFDFFAGRIRQAPRLVQRSGFEWLWRLLSRDFFRLFHRYTFMNVRFLALFARDGFGQVWR